MRHFRYDAAVSADVLDRVRGRLAIVPRRLRGADLGTVG
jgi:hypothetical protein